MSLPYSYTSPLRGEPALDAEEPEYNACETCDKPIPEGDRICAGCEEEEERELEDEEGE